MGPHTASAGCQCATIGSGSWRRGHSGAGHAATAGSCSSIKWRGTPPQRFIERPVPASGPRPERSSILNCGCPTQRSSILTGGSRLAFGGGQLMQGPNLGYPQILFSHRI